MASGEFELIARHFARGGASRPDVRLGVGDDGALLAVPAGQELVLALDTLVEGAHFPKGFDARFVGHRALAVNLSDLAAMGAEPAWALLGITLPSADEPWLSGFSAGFDALARRHGVALVGGDTTRGPLTVTVTVGGTVPAGQALRRDGARVGDDVWISGTPGDAAAGLAILSGRLPAQGRAREALLARFQLPQARVALGAALRGLATACIDVSDGLAGDLAKLCAASGVGADLESRELPLSAGLCSVAMREARLSFALGGGDDYELLFTADPSERARLQALDAGVVLKRIGTVSAEPGVRVDGAPPARDAGHGFDHFAAAPDGPG
ncbi:MAG TPA: thiamine-phosphate kinase [Steroidobacteraceae bacterium]|nr:thiamine-phosphate kinase [Steroidobacteraceae bacterium]